MTGARGAARPARYLSGLKPMRKKAGLTQTELARATGATRQSILQWETGDYWPSASWLPKLARACGCSIEELYYPPEEEGQP